MYHIPYTLSLHHVLYTILYMRDSFAKWLLVQKSVQGVGSSAEAEAVRSKARLEPS